MNSVSPFKLFCLIVLSLSSSVLHICGFYSPYWVNEKSSFECFSRVLYTVNCPDNIVSLWHILKYVYQQNMIKIKTSLQWNLTSKRIFEGLSDGVLGLQSISMIFIIISTINTVYSVVPKRTITRKSAAMNTARSSFLAFTHSQVISNIKINLKITFFFKWQSYFSL